MSDVFVSYARCDEPQAERVAEALRALGYGVWRDDELPAHRAYADVIEERLKSAKAVVVLVVGGSGEIAMGARRSRRGAIGRNDGSGPPRRHHSADALQPDPVRGPQAIESPGKIPGWAKLVGSRL